MKDENDKNTGKTADVCSVSSEEIPNEILFFIRRYFLIEKDMPTLDEILRANLLAKVTITLMLQLYRMGMEEEFQPVFFAGNYVKPHTGGVTEFKRTYETISGEPFFKFNLTALGQEYEEAYKKWFKATFGVEINEEAAKVIQAWGDAVGEGKE